MIDTIDDKDPVPLKVPPSSKIEPSPDIGNNEREIGNEERSFASLMQNKPQESAQAPMQAPKVQPVSPFDLAGLETRPLPGATEIGAKPIASPDTESLMRQANLTQNTFGSIQGQLSYPNLKLKSSQKYLVKNKLSDANNHLRAANAKLGISPEASSDENTPSKENTAIGPIAQYLGYVTDGMNQIEAAKKQLTTISAQGANLAPADYMLLQLKFNKAQQELEFTSAVLSKSIEGLKTMMNIQI